MAATDLFRDEPVDYSAPACDGAEVTPNDGTDLAISSRALYVGGAGDLKVTMKGGGFGETGSTITLQDVPAGTLLPLAVDRVFSTGTTATNIVALW